VDRLNAVSGLEVLLHGLPSPYWGQDQVVTGLLTGADLKEGLADCDLGEELLLPSVVLRQGEPLFLDDLRLDDLVAELPVPIRLVQGADDVVSACLRSLDGADSSKGFSCSCRRQPDQLRPSRSCG
jgi:NifB/MoaA-like Fe-S oxidoreductase